METEGRYASSASDVYGMLRNTTTTTRKGAEEVWRCDQCDYIFIAPSTTFDCERCGNDVNPAPKAIRDRLIRGRG